VSDLVGVTATGKPLAGFKDCETVYRYETRSSGPFEVWSYRIPRERLTEALRKGGKADADGD
jgi:hypothetical protein